MSEVNSLGYFQNDSVKTDVDEESPNFLNVRMVMLQNLCNWHATEKTPSRSLYNSLQKQKASLVSRPDDALDAVRGIFQKTLDKEIDEIVQRFYQKYLVPAIKNIQTNGYEVVSTDIFSVYHRILDEAKKMYPLGSILENNRATSNRPTGGTPDLGLLQATTATSGGQMAQTKLINRHIPAGLRKRKEAADSDTDSDISQVSAVIKKKARADRAAAPKRGAAAAGSQTAGPLKNVDIPFEDVEKWNPDRIDENTVFALGSKANSALGLSAQRGRIYIKHPGLFRYVGDHDDKMWLFENKQKTVKFGGKAFLVILDDIMQLAESPEYKNNPESNLEDLNAFTLPPFIRDKIKAQMDTVYRNLRTKYGLDINIGPVVTDAAATTTNAAMQEDRLITEAAGNSSATIHSSTALSFDPVMASSSPAATSEGADDP